MDCDAATRAREHQNALVGALGQARIHRRERNRLIRQLRATDPQTWTYPALADAVGCSDKLVAAIVKGRTL